MNSYHDWRWGAKIIAIFLIVVEIILNATSSSVHSYVAMFATVIITIAGAAASPIASKAWHAGQKVASVALVSMFLPLVLAISFQSSLERVAGRLDSSVQRQKAQDTAQKMADTTYEAALAIKNRACGTDKTDTQRMSDPACVKASKAFLKQTGSVTDTISRIEGEVGDAVTKRIASLLAPLGVSEENAMTYLPMIWPLALLIGGFIFAHIGWGYTNEPAQIATIAEVREVAPVAVETSRSNLTQQQALEAVQGRIRDAGGELRVKSIRSLAGQIGAAPASLDVWMRRWKNTHLTQRKDGQEIVLAITRVKLAVSQ